MQNPRLLRYLCHSKLRAYRSLSLGNLCVCVISAVQCAGGYTGSWSCYSLCVVHSLQTQDRFAFCELQLFGKCFLTVHGLSCIAPRFNFLCCGVQNKGRYHNGLHSAPSEYKLLHKSAVVCSQSWDRSEWYTYVSSIKTVNLFPR